MSFTLSTRYSALGNIINIDSVRQVTGDVQVAMAPVIANGATDTEIVLGIDISEAKLVVFKADQALTVKTNSSGAPDDTLALVANIPRAWQENDYNALFLSADVSSIFVTNSSGSDATLQVLAIVDNP